MHILFNVYVNLRLRCHHCLLTSWVQVVPKFLDTFFFLQMFAARTTQVNIVSSLKISRCRVESQSTGRKTQKIFKTSWKGSAETIFCRLLSLTCGSPFWVYAGCSSWNHSQTSRNGRTEEMKKKLEKNGMNVALILSFTFH